jgi:hypothetical protein
MLLLERHQEYSENFRPSIPKNMVSELDCLLDY